LRPRNAIWKPLAARRCSPSKQAPWAPAPSLRPFWPTCAKATCWSSRSSIGSPAACANLLDIVAQVEAKGASLRILSMSLDTSNATGKLVLQMFGAVAEWERSTMLEREREGIAKAKADGKYKGRAPTALRKASEVRSLAQRGKGMTEIARELDIGRTSVWRILNPQAAQT